jgi:hypothetical protein
VEEEEEEEEEKVVEVMEKKKAQVLFSTTAQSFVFVLLHISATYCNQHQGAIKI